MSREGGRLHDIHGLDCVGILASSHMWLSNSGDKPVDNAVCSRPFMAHPRILHCLVSHISLQHSSYMSYLLAALQKTVKILKSMLSLWILYSGSYSLQSRRLLGPSVASKQNLRLQRTRNHEGSLLYFFFCIFSQFI